ncbi:MAG: DUF29 domain-containing protein [Neisseriales bacterium]|jgi:hypothetical protein|nr:MAG: DUF29 domain-containing protein [Neisseriales bacterium]
MSTLSLYEKDFYAWTQEQANFLKQKDFDKLDLLHLMDEVESMGNQNKTELKNRLAVLLMHLLKWKFQPELKSNSWYLTIANQRLDIADLIDDNPSLKHFLPELFDKAYAKAVTKANIETGIKKSAFPDKCEWSIEQVLNEEFFPN